MASISSLSGSSSSSSIYGNRSYNIISGLASGLDTEELISGLVKSYQQKIQSLQNKNTKYQWQQEGIQSISDKLVEFDRNYSSYVYSNTNLSSPSFFNNAVKTTTNGTYANLVTASGKTSSTVVLNAVKRLATAARYTHSADGLNANATVNDKTITVTGNDKVDLAGDMSLSKLAGSLTLNYGSRTVSIDFSDVDVYADKDGKLDATAYKNAIVEKLSAQQISTSSGSVVKADTLIGVDVTEDGTVSFYDKSTGGNTVSIAGASGDLADMIDGLDSVVSAKGSTFKLKDATNVVEKTNVAGYLAGKSFTVSLDGKSKTITFPSTVASTDDEFIKTLNNQLNNAFGNGKVTADFKDGKLTFDVSKGSTLSVTASDDGVGKALGIGSGLTSYLDTTKTLGDLNLLNSDQSKWDWGSGVEVKGTGPITEQKDKGGNITGYVDASGHAVDKEGYLIDEDKNRLRGVDLVINGVKIGTYTKETEMNTVINNINSNTEAGVNVSYSKTTGQFVFTAKDTGEGGRIQIDEGGLGAALFGAVNPDSSPTNYDPGQDAEVIATINGQAMMLTRSSNSFDIDGMNITVSGVFNKDANVEESSNKVMIGEGADKKEVTDSVTFTSKTDADTIVDAVKKMVEDLNAIIKEVKSAYSDMPLSKSDGSKYEPLSDDDMADMSESAIEAYEEKAKTGILFMDSDLSSLYNDLRNAISSSGADGVTLRSIGINTSYSDGLTTLTFDEQAFREALESNPDKVQEAFTKSKENGAATDGLMATIKSITDRYAATTGDVKGILIEKAGSKYSPTAALDNTLLNQMKDVEDEIAKWQDKMSNQVDYYTNKFTQLEMLMNQMNSQSSALAGLMGG